MKAKIILLVGILFFGALATVGYFTIITEGGPFQKKLNVMTVYFPNAEGLKIGNKVTVQGVPYGYISRISLVNIDKEGNITKDIDKAITSRVEVQIALTSTIRLYDNYDITIKNESLLSGRVIAIDPGTAFEKPQGKKVEAQLKEPILIGEKDKEGKPLPYKGPKINGRTAEDPLVSLSELIAENREDIRSTVSNIAEITGKINNGKGTLGKLINEGDIHKNVNITLSDAQIVLRELREGLEDTREQAPVTSFIRAALSAF
ncbi:MAG: MCE family protein [Leptospiraceae bacterium]|nr:MCE family protein [Leptospiraceae bacterium]MCP5502792.1 MCE family protein [Leptospiraceae bacterium]